MNRSPHYYRCKHRAKGLLADEVLVNSFIASNKTKRTKRPFPFEEGVLLHEEEPLLAVKGGSLCFIKSVCLIGNDFFDNLTCTL